jgi:hypothetical protein
VFPAISSFPVKASLWLVVETLAKRICVVERIWHWHTVQHCRVVLIVVVGVILTIVEGNRRGSHYWSWWRGWMEERGFH